MRVIQNQSHSLCRRLHLVCPATGSATNNTRDWGLGIGGPPPDETVGGFAATGLDAFRRMKPPRLVASRDGSDLPRHHREVWDKPRPLADDISGLLTTFLHKRRGVCYLCCAQHNGIICVASGKPYEPSRPSQKPPHAWGKTNGQLNPEGANRCEQGSTHARSAPKRRK